MKHPKVTVVFQPSGATAADAVTAPNQQVFIDLTAGTMTAAQTDAQGLLVTPAPGSKPIELDDTRTYQVVLSATKVAGAPAASTGAKASVASGKLILQPQIAIKVTGITASLACSLTIGGKTTAVKTSTGGWIISNDTSAGAVTLSSATKFLKVKGAADPAVTITVPSTITRGDSSKFAVAPPAGTVDFKVTEWTYVASHTNPDKTTADTATITRPASEATATFHQFWEGIMCASGALNVHFVCGASLRVSGSTAVAAEVVAADPLTKSADIAVTARAWTTTLTENPEAPLTKAIATAEDTGQHKWGFSDRAVSGKAIASGPNLGVTFAGSSKLTFTSSPAINSLLTDASSTFSQAQGKAYLLTPVVANKEIPKKFYSKGTAGAITLTDKAGFLAFFSITGPFTVTAECVDQATLLAGTRRHEFTHASNRSHKANCLKALRALDPRTFIEAHAQLPGATALDFTKLYNARVDLVAGVGPLHSIVDETATASAGAVKFVSGATIPDINANAAGTLLGPVWNPTAQSELT